MTDRTTTHASTAPGAGQASARRPFRRRWLPRWLLPEYLAVVPVAAVCLLDLHAAIAAGPTTPAPARPADWADATVVRPVDAERVRAKAFASPERTVWLGGIDAPEPGECYGKQAAAAVARLLAPGTDIRLERDVIEAGPDGQPMAWVRVERGGEWTMVSQVLVERGIARAGDTGHSPRGVAIQAAQARARAAGRGLWGACPAT